VGRNFLPKCNSLLRIEEAAGLYHGTDKLHLRQLTCGFGNPERRGEWEVVFVRAEDENKRVNLFW
jgi:hypothetical protein